MRWEVHIIIFVVFLSKINNLNLIMENIKFKLRDSLNQLTSAKTSSQGAKTKKKKKKLRNYQRLEKTWQLMQQEILKKRDTYKKM